MINVVELDERINKCLSILEENPRSRIFAALAEAYRRRGDVGKAFSVCKNGLRIHPDYGAAYVVMAKLYLHQNMADQAQRAVEHAIELDGPSRSSDVLLAEIHMMLGECKKAREILDRLARDGGEDSVVRDLRKRLKDAVRRNDLAPPLAASGDLTSPEPTVHETRVRRDAPVETEMKGVCADPGQAVAELVRFPGAAYCAIYGREGTLLAVQSKPGVDFGPNQPVIMATYLEIDQLVNRKGWGSLSALRIEDSRGQWGFLTEQNLVAVILGTARLGYAGVSRKAMQYLRQLAGWWTSRIESALPEGRTERVPQ